jgi:hypothetical protein
VSRDPVNEITQHLDKTDDPNLLILRSHLLVEERLRAILAQTSRAPDELRAARGPSPYANGSYGYDIVKGNPPGAESLLAPVKPLTEAEEQRQREVEKWR